MKSYIRDRGLTKILFDEHEVHKVVGVHVPGCQVTEIDERKIIPTHCSMKGGNARAQ